MPATASNISPELSRKKLVKADPIVEPKKSMPQIFEMKTTDSALCGNQGETPAKKLTKTTKQGNKGGRRVSSAVNDAANKKNAQKTKGSLSLNKTDQQEGDQKVKRTPQELIQSSDPVLPQMAQTHAGTRGTDGEMRKSNVPVRIKSRNKRAPPKEAKIPPKQKFAVPPATEQPGGAPAREKSQEPESPVGAKNEDIHTVSPVINSCSFFERIQQGVKAYFGSRSSFNTGDRNKKEGGAEWPSGQEATAEVASRNVKKIKKSSARPQNTPSTAKTMTDRSTVEFHTQEPPSAALRRLERHIESKICSKAEVSGMASTSFEISHLPIEKTVKKEQKPVVEFQIPKSRGPGPAPEPLDPMSLELLERLGRAANDEASSYPFRHMLDEYLSSHCPDRSDSEDALSLEDVARDFTNREAQGQTSAISENPSSSNFQETVNWWRAWPRVGDDISEILAFCNDFPTDDNQSTCGLQIPCYKPFETLMYPVSPSFSREFPMRYLKTPSLSLIREESPLAIENERTPKEEDLLRAEAQTHIPQGEQVETTSEDLPPGEFPLTETFKSLTNNLQIDSLENCRSLDRSSGDSQTDKEEYFEVEDNKSGSSFASAVSLLSQEIPPGDLEGAPCLNRFLSLTKIAQRLSGVRKTKSENDLKALKNGVAGKTMRFPHVSEGINDGYEKILPLGISKATIDSKKGGRGSLLSFEVAEEATEEMSEEAGEEMSEEPAETSEEAAEETSEEVVETSEEAAEETSEEAVETSEELVEVTTEEAAEETSEEATEATEATEEASGEDSPLEDEKPALAYYHEGKGWSPTLPELTEIYDSILKENKKIQRKGLIPERCLSSYMMSFLKKKLTEKRLKMELVDFSKSFRDSFRPKYWKPGKVNDYSFGLAEYVAAFQEILHSNLSVKQITGLNNALSTFQDYHDQTHLFLTDQATKKTGRGKAKKKQEKFTSDEVQKIKLSTPTDLETVLKKFNSDEQEEEKKLLVTVKLSGNHVLVNSLAYFGNEDHLTPKKTKTKGTSELIIENLTKQSGEKPADQKPTKIGKQEPVESKVSKTPRNEEAGHKKDIPQPKKEVPEFHYNQFLLRAQHPIEAIVEGTEPKPDKAEKGKCRGKSVGKEKPKSAGHNEIKRNKGNPRGFRGKLQNALSGKIYLKDLFHEFAHEEVGKPIKRVGSSGSGSQAKRWFSATKKKAETVRSMFELKKTNSGKSGKPRSTYLCYPSVMSFQEKTPKKIKDKSRYCAKGTVPATTYKQPKQLKNVNRPINKAEANKKPAREPEPTPGVPKTSNVGSATQTSNVSSVTQTSNVSSVTQTLNVSSVTQTSNVSSVTQTSNVSAVTQTLNVGSVTQAETPQQKEEPVKSVPEAPAGELPKVADCCSIELLVSDTSGSALPEASKKAPEDLPRESGLPLPAKAPPATGAPKLAKESAPILLHCSKSDADGKSFRSEIIHSDSFLKYCTPIKVTHSKLRSLFKCNSDIKFYPGRVCDSSDTHEPFITFVLTPRQNETSGLPGNLVQVVQKTGTVEPTPEEKREEEAKVTLRDIEKFIAEMANFKRRAIQRQKQNMNQKKASAVKFDTRHRTPPGPGDQSNSGTGRSPERKFYHECQRRKMAQEQATAPKRAVTPTLRQKRSMPGEMEGEKPDVVLDNLIRKTCLAVTNLFKNKYLEDQKAERMEKMKDKATEMSSSENKCGTLISGVTSRSDSNGGQEEYENISVIPNELLQAIKLAIDQVDGLEGKERIIAAIEDVEKKRSAKEVEKQPNSPTSPPKKSKTIRIKIRCKGHKCTEKTVEIPAGNHEEGRQEQDSDIVVAEIETVDAPASKDAEGSTLGSTNSTYFDALEKNEEAGGAGEMAADVRRMSRPAVHEVPSAEFFVTDSKSPASLTPSDEMLLTTVSFEKEKEEIIYKKISKYLEEGKVSYSMTLLDVFLKKTENSLDDVDSRLRLNDLLSLVEKKSRNLMINLEKNAWIKVLSLLEEATRVLDDESIKHSKKTLLVEKIQSLNLEKLADLEEFYSHSPTSSNEYIRNEEGQEGSVLRLIRESLAFLKQKVVRKRSRASRPESPMDEDTESSESAFRIHSANGFPEMREPPGGPNARYLKNKLRQQRARIERLINANGDLFSPKIEDLKNIVMMKMKSLEQYHLGESSKGACPRYRASHTALDGKREGKRGSRESLTRSPGYVDLVRYFMKAWDARMSLSSLSNCHI